MGKTKRKKPASLTSLKGKAWDLLSRVVRISAANSDGFVHCYTCSWVGHYKHAQAGHAIGGRHGAVLFDEEIIRVQCLACNRFKRGNYAVFEYNLIRDYGKGGREWWEQKLIGSFVELKRYRSDYNGLIADFTKRLNDLADLPSLDAGRYPPGPKSGGVFL